MVEEVALATTKRKFYKALDVFTTTSQASLVESSTSTERPATAAEAFDEARERAKKRLRHSTSSSSLPYKVNGSTSAKKDDPNRSKDPPNFSPWSQETFLARLKTFGSVSLWHPKPEAINEVEWAKRGWVCVDVNTVACRGGCERRVVVSLDRPGKEQPEDGGDEEEDDDGSEDEAAFEQALAERYRDVIIEGHAETCLWRKGACKDDIYHLQIGRPSVWQPELRKRIESIRAIAGDVKDLELRTLQAHDTKILTPQRLLKDLPADIVEHHDGDESDIIALRVLEIALHGWRGSAESGSTLLCCDACFQRIGLWMYQPGYKAAHSGSEDEDESSATIDLVEMHREHCPWRNPSTQKASGTLKGLNACEILQRVVSTYARDHRRKSREQAGAGDDGEEQQPGETVAEGEHKVLSREEVAQQDKERESRLRKIKNMFTIRRRPKSVPNATVP